MVVHTRIELVPRGSHPRVRHPSNEPWRFGWVSYVPRLPWARPRRLLFSTTSSVSLTGLEPAPSGFGLRCSSVRASATKWYPCEDSNLSLRVRSPAFYSLILQGQKLVSGDGFEPPTTLARAALLLAHPNMVFRSGTDPLSSGFQPDALTI